MPSPALDRFVMVSQTINQGGVIWITGYSAAGKTSVARLVASSIRHSGVPAIHLDGDDLRAILGNKWGYSKADRLELARSYIRLCSHIASHEILVVISAVAMYDEVFSWFRENVPRAMLVYLDAPEEVRRRRDALTKGLYSDLMSSNQHYQPPMSPDLTLRNDDEASLTELAESIVARFDNMVVEQADRGRTKHWNEFYEMGRGVLDPSPFAIEVQRALEKNAHAMHLVEVGCGNGRDSAFFASLGCHVTAFDTSGAAIEYCKKIHEGLVQFREGTLGTAELRECSVDAIYCRFVLHAMTVEEEDEFLAASSLLLKPNGRLFIEARSIHDPLARKGEVLSATERIEGHYRRFIVAEELRQKLISEGLQIEAMAESNGFARFGNEDPVVIRVTARKAHP